ncbi:hypothetical protein PanWU01x14_202820, partial [Parasponia andersonii]
RRKPSMADGSGRSSKSSHNSRPPTLQVIHSQSESVQLQKQSVQWKSISSSSTSTRHTVTEFFQSVQRTSISSSTSLTKTTTVSQKYSISGPQHHEVCSKGSISKNSEPPYPKIKERDNNIKKSLVCRKHKDVVKMKELQGQKKLQNLK